MNTDSILYFYQDTMSLHKLILILFFFIPCSIIALVFVFLSLQDGNLRALTFSFLFLLLFNLGSYGAYWNWKKGCMNWFVIDRHFKLFFKEYEKEIIKIDIEEIDSILIQENDGNFKMKFIFKDQSTVTIPSACVPMDIEPFKSIIKTHFENVKIFAVASLVTDEN